MSSLQRRQLKFMVRIRPISPVHIGVGNEFLGRGAYHLFDGGRQLALLAIRPLASRLFDEPSLQGAGSVERALRTDTYPRAVTQDIESGKLAQRLMGVHPGALPHLDEVESSDRTGTKRLPNELKIMTALASGLPYIPGSSVKGALRTAWLDWQTQQQGAYGRFVKEVRQSRAGDRRSAKEADDSMMERKQVAESLIGSLSRTQSQNRDLFRAVQVSDFLPDRTQKLSRVYAVMSMSYQSGSRGHARPSNEGQAGAQAWECLDPTAGASYLGTLTVDLDLLRRMQTGDQDARMLAAALGDAAAWKAALAGYGTRVYETESAHYDETLANLPAQSSDGIQLEGHPERIVNWMMAEEQDRLAEHLLPLGMGSGLLSHSVLGATAPEDVGGLLGDEGKPVTLLKEVLDTGLRRDPQAYVDGEFPRPKSRRVTGKFTNSSGQKLQVKNMQAERPLGWTVMHLEVEK